MTTLKAALTDLDIVRIALDDDYEVTGELGRGGMAMVYRARERQLDREVAIKVLPFALAHDAELVERFQREARLSARLEHPHIVPIYRVGRRDQVIYIVMKLLRGQSLSARLAAQGRLPAAEVRRVLVETARALGHAHERGVVHRDVKPDNVMLDEAGRCVVTDFGIARSAADTKLTAAGMSLGTPRYMSPEQARAREVDGRSDLYSLGVVGYECLVGHTPFDGSDAVAILMDHVQAPVPRPAVAESGTAEERALFCVIERLLAKTPEERFSTADALIAALDGGAAAVVPAARPLAPTAPIRAPASVEPHDSLGRAPQSSAALDSALATGLELLEQQRPRVQAALTTGLQAASAAGRQLVRASTPRVRAASAWARARGVRFWKRAAAAVAACWIVYAGGHYLLKQRSRCPRLLTASDATADSVARRQSFTVLADPIGSMRQGADLDLYYDVCGLDAGTVKTRITVTKSESGLRRLFGDGVGPVTVSSESAVTGPAMRRHESIDFDRMPAGAYTLDVVVHDAKGRQRETDVAFQVVER
jgi:hypothetical protein